jgi:hypothetical protein
MGCWSISTSAALAMGAAQRQMQVARGRRQAAHMARLFNEDMARL